MLVVGLTGLLRDTERDAWKSEARVSASKISTLARYRGVRVLRSCCSMLLTVDRWQQVEVMQ